MNSEQLQELIRNAGYEPYAYSGRAMYGKLCVAVNVRSTTDFYADVLSEAARNDDYPVDEVAALVKRASTDSMGMDAVVYWPSYPMEHEEVEKKDFHMTVEIVVCVDITVQAEDETDACDEVEAMDPQEIIAKDDNAGYTIENVTAEEVE